MLSAPSFADFHVVQSDLGSRRRVSGAPVEQEPKGSPTLGNTVRRWAGEKHLRRGREVVIRDWFLPLSLPIPRRGNLEIRPVEVRPAITIHLELQRRRSAHPCHSRPRGEQFRPLQHQHQHHGDALGSRGSRGSSNPEPSPDSTELVLAILEVRKNPPKQLPELRPMVRLSEMGQFMSQHVLDQ